MNCVKKAKTVVLISTLLAGSVTARADELLNSSNATFELCGSTFPGLTTTYDDRTSYTSEYYSSQQAQARATVSDALTMISREGVWDKTISLSSSCSTWRTNWFNDSVAPSFEHWYEPMSTLSGYCGTPVAGCTTTNTPNISFASVGVANDFGYGVVNQDTRYDYLSDGVGCASFENLWLHELGHAYGLEHDDATIGIMNGSVACNKNFHKGLGRSSFYWPADNAQMRSRYEIPPPGSRRNYSASAFYRSGSTIYFDAPSTVHLSSGYTSHVFAMSYSFERFFANSGSNVIVQMRWVPDLTEPTYNSSTKTYTWPTFTSTNTFRLDAPSTGTADTTVHRQWNLTVTRAEIPATGVIYRLWMHVDFANTAVETDEGDNMIPTGYTVLRTN